MKRLYSTSIKVIIVLLSTFSISNIFAQPTGFVDEAVSSDWTIPTGLTFDTYGRMYVWEKSGKVYLIENNNKSLLIDISEEVLDFNDHGLNGVVLDPNFSSNGYIYLLYVAKRYHVINFGTPEYDPEINANEPFRTTIGRVVRYTADVSNGSPIIDYESRNVLIGENISSGIPILVDAHGVGSLVFGSDGTLLVSVGDVAVASEPIDDETSNPWFQETVNVGIVTNDQLVNVYRSQLLNSLNGKILRINPANGDGVSSNPYFDSNNNRSAQSRIWTLGLRNPFRFTVKPNTGSGDPNDANPGVLYIGDVGWFHREEMNIIDAGGKNCGWPAFEGINYMNGSYQEPSFFPQNHHQPVIEWRGPVAQAKVNGDIYSIGSAEFMGDAFTGNASIGGLWYTASNFPSQYQNTYFHGDYMGWIKSFGFGNNNHIQVENFVEDIHPTCMAVNPTDGAIYYISFLYPDIHEVRKLLYDPNANQSPIAVILASPPFGQNPLNVLFDGSQSSDPENTALTYEWDFGDGSTDTGSNPSHIYDVGNNDPIAKIARLKVTDAGGKSTTKTILISINNTPPEIQTTTVDAIDSFCNNADLQLSLDNLTNDSEQQNQLIYQWVVSLRHENHSHVQSILNNPQGNVTLATVPQDGQLYYYHISLKVTDPIGLTDTFEKDIFPSLTVNNDFLNLSDPNDTFSLGSILKHAKLELNASNSILNANVKYKAGNSITLNPGFKAEQGSVFSAKIEAACNN